MDEIIYASATQIARSIRDEELSAAEVVETHLRRIGGVNPRLNAVVQIMADRAISDVRVADQSLAYPGFERQVDPPNGRFRESFRSHDTSLGLGVRFIGVPRSGASGGGLGETPGMT